jgi:hypothetical protein
MTDFKLQAAWQPALGTSEDDATIARLVILLGAKNLTQYKGTDQPDGDFLVIPVYHLAEWIAENYWALMHEPQKSDSAGGDDSFMRRHSVIAAQRGFVLPRVQIVPNGDEIRVNATRKRGKFADIQFVNSADALLPRNQVASTLKHFIGHVIERLNSQKLVDTPLHEYWQLITETDADQEVFCRLMGALGLSPYRDYEDVEKILESAIASLGEIATYDLCLASTPETIAMSVRMADKALAFAKDAAPIALEKLIAVERPLVNPHLPAWKRGIEAAKRVRNQYQIKGNDPYGMQHFFDDLGLSLDGNIGKNLSEDNADQPAIAGAMVRDGSEARIGLPQKRIQQRRFTAVRGVYAAWMTSTPRETHLITHAITRDQQESRAFAAELLAPIEYIRSARGTGRLTRERMHAIADDLGVGSDVVQYQAMNNGIAGLAI